MRQMIRWGLIGLLIIFGGIAYMQDVQNSVTAAYPCPYTNAPYFRAGVFPRHEITSGQLVMVGPTGETVQVLETIVDDVRIINWSPDCHYLTGAVGEIRYISDEGSSYLPDYQQYVSWNRKDIVIWDTINGGRVQTFANNVGRYLINGVQPAVIWHPTGASAVILAGCYQVRYTCAFERPLRDDLWNRATNTVYPVGSPDPRNYWNRNHASFNQYLWDDARSWLWSGGRGGVSALSMNTGEEVHFFPAQSANTQPAPADWIMDSVETRFNFSPDGSRVIVYSYYFFYPDGAGSITVYTIDTGEAQVVNAEGYAAQPIAITDNQPVALSPDNRYLVAGYDAIRVWDLTQLPADEVARLPIYRHGGPNALIHTLRFVAPDVIETVSDDGIQKWNLHTGIYIAD